MQIVDKPYFMTNEEWYFYDIKMHKLALTEKAPPEAVKSYNEFYDFIKKSRFEND